jgi:carbon-monoxide dehydrogenase medium subunit
MRFEYLEPASLSEAITLLDRYNNRAKIIAGGTDLVIQMRKRKIRPEYVIAISRLTELDYIRFAGNELQIGALTTISTLEKATELKEKYPAIPQMALQMATPGIRNMATLGGNLSNAAPSADSAPILIALSAKVKIKSPQGERILPLKDFCTGPGSTCLEKNELLTEIQIPLPPPHTGAVYLKQQARGAGDTAMAGVAIALTLEPQEEVCREVTIVLGAVAAKPIRVMGAEQVLKGKKLEDKLLEESSVVASKWAKPKSDFHVPMAYRIAMVEVFTRRALREALKLARIT